MDLDDAARRIFRHHGVLLLVLTVAGALLAVAATSTRPVTYSASARIVLDVTDPKSPVEAQAVADVVRAIVTSPGRVADGMRQVAPSRNAHGTAGHVSVASVGTSRIVTVTVTDRDPRVARDLANALATTVVTVRSSVAGSQRAITATDDRVAAISQSLAGLEAQLDTATNATAQAPTADARATAAAEAESLRGERDRTASQLAAAQDDRAKLVSDDLAKLRPSVLDRATLPTSPNPSSVAQNAALGALAGLLIGLALAAAIETLSPTLAGKRAIAEHLGAPVLVRLDGSDPPDATSVRELSRRVALVCDDVQTCIFVDATREHGFQWLTALVSRVELSLTATLSASGAIPTAAAPPAVGRPSGPGGHQQERRPTGSADPRPPGPAAAPARPSWSRAPTSPPRPSPPVRAGATAPAWWPPIWARTCRSRTPSAPA